MSTTQPPTRNSARSAPAEQGHAPATRATAGRCSSSAQELELLIRARYSIVYVVSWEEERVERALRRIAKQRNKKLLTWSFTQGLTHSSEAGVGRPSRRESTADPLTALDSLLDQVEPAIYLFKDFHPFTEDNRANLAIIRRLRDAAQHLRETYKSLVIVAPLLRLAPELSKDVAVVEFDLPGRPELGALVDRIASEVGSQPGIRLSNDPQDREKLLKAASGLTLREAENVFAKTLVLRRSLHAGDVDVVLSEKKQIIRKSGLLEYYEANDDLEQVAGLSHLKSWLAQRGLAFSEQAAQFGLPAPRGILLLGVQGCGKSLCAKAVAGSWRMPLLRFDVGRMFDSLVGSSEENVRRAIAIAESIAPAILWIDEIDKVMAGAANSGLSDGGTASRVLATLLTWLAEKTAPVFVIATANQVAHLPAELLRKGRFDEIFFVDLPEQAERVELLQLHLAKRGREPAEFDLPRLAAASDGFSGAEIEEAIVSALFEAFSRRQELDSSTIEQCMRATAPLSRLMCEELQALRRWAQGRTRQAAGAPIAFYRETRRRIEF